MIQDSLNEPAARELQMKCLTMGGVGKPEKVAYGVIYLAFEEHHGYRITGSGLVIDSGTTPVSIPGIFS